MPEIWISREYFFCFFFLLIITFNFHFRLSFGLQRLVLNLQLMNNISGYINFLVPRTIFATRDCGFAFLYHFCDHLYARQCHAVIAEKLICCLFFVSCILYYLYYYYYLGCVFCIFS